MLACEVSVGGKQQSDCRPTRFSRFEACVGLEPSPSHIGTRHGKRASASKPTAATTRAKVHRTVKFRIRGKQPPKASRWKGRRVQCFRCRVMCAHELVSVLHELVRKTGFTQDMGRISMAEGRGSGHKQIGVGVGPPTAVPWRPCLQAARSICFCNQEYPGLFSR